MSNKDSKNKDKVEERRSNDIGDDIIDRRRSVERRVILADIDFEDRRKGHRRKPIVGVDFKDRRNSKK